MRTTENSSSIPIAAVYLLEGKPHEVELWTQSLIYLERYLIRQSPCAVVAFVKEGFPEDWTKLIQDQTALPVHFPLPVSANEWECFCRGAWLSHPALKHIEWAWRFTADAWLTQSVNGNLLVQDASIAFASLNAVEEATAEDSRKDWEKLIAAIADYPDKPETPLVRWPVRGVFLAQNALYCLSAWRCKRVAAFLRYLEDRAAKTAVQWSPEAVLTAAALQFLPPKARGILDAVSMQTRDYEVTVEHINN